MCILDFKNLLWTKKNSPTGAKTVHRLSLFEYGFIYQFVSTTEIADVLLNKV